MERLEMQIEIEYNLKNGKFLKTVKDIICELKKEYDATHTLKFVIKIKS